jgi:hypothetical protein
MATDRSPLTPEDEALLDRVARRVVDLRLEVPAILALESVPPLTVVAGQAMLFFEPFVAAMFRFPDYRRFAALIERRDVLEELCRRIETTAGSERARRSAAGSAREGR